MSLLVFPADAKCLALKENVLATNLQDPDVVDKGHELYKYLSVPTSACESMPSNNKNSLGLSTSHDSIYGKGRNGTNV